MFENVSFLYPYKPDHGHRDRVFMWIKEFFQETMPGVEICIGESNDELFNRSKAINEAANKASNDIFVIADGDIIFDPDIILESIKYLEKYSWVIPFQEVINISEQNTQKLLESTPMWPLDVEIKEYVTKRFYHSFVGKLNVITREKFFAVEGFDERFKGWGGEDDAFGYAMNTICGPFKRLDKKLYHFWHPHVGQQGNPHYKENFALYRAYQAVRGNKAEIMKLINQRNHDS